jgi:hypothetical protein
MHARNAAHPCHHLRAVDSLEFAECALKKGYSKLLVQHGNGSCMPHNLVKEGESEGIAGNGLEVK